MGKMMREDKEINFCNQLEEETRGYADRCGGSARVRPERRLEIRSSELKSN